MFPEVCIKLNSTLGQYKKIRMVSYWEVQVNTRPHWSYFQAVKLRNKAEVSLCLSSNSQAVNLVLKADDKQQQSVVPAEVSMSQAQKPHCIRFGAVTLLSLFPDLNKQGSQCQTLTKQILVIAFQNKTHLYSSYQYFDAAGNLFSWGFKYLLVEMTVNWPQPMCDESSLHWPHYFYLHQDQHFRNKPRCQLAHV